MLNLSVVFPVYYGTCAHKINRSSREHCLALSEMKDLFHFYVHENLSQGPSRFFFEAGGS